MANALLEDICRHGASVMHASTALPWDRAPVKTGVHIKKCLENSWTAVLLRGSWRHRSEILAAELRTVPTAADARVSAESDLSSVHDGWVIGDEIVTIFTVLGDDGISGSSCGIGSVTWAVAVVDLEKTLSDQIGADVADTVSSLAEGVCGRGIDEPRMGEDFLNGDPRFGAGIEHS